MFGTHEKWMKTKLSRKFEELQNTRNGKDDSGSGGSKEQGNSRVDEDSLK